MTDTQETTSNDELLERMRQLNAEVEERRVNGSLPRARQAERIGSEPRQPSTQESAWSIRLTSGKLIGSNEVTAAHGAVVGGLIDSTDIARLNPAQNLDALIMWVAVLETAETGDGDDLQVEVDKIMRLPMVDVLARLE